MKRRHVLSLLAAAPVAAAALPALAQDKTFSEMELAVAGPLGDVELGAKDAKVVIYEYASMTCGHCAAFHEKTFPELKKKYIDTGKVRFILREFPLDPLAVAGFMLARCSGAESYHAVIDLLFAKQKDWTQTDKPVDALFNTVKAAGFTQEKFESCLKDQKVYDAVLAVRERGVKTFNVGSTPTFFINGKMERGALSITEFDRILTPLVGG